jgi:hypothetical protein
VKVKVFGIVSGLLLALGASAAAAGTSATATVENTATVTGAVSVVFEFDLYDCPAGAEIAIVDWTANEPSRPDSGAAGGLQPYGLSNGAPVQHLVFEINSSSFLPGERWVGSGSIACGTVLIPVAGAGQAKALNGV